MIFELRLLARGFEKFFMEGVYSRCQSFGTKLNYFDIFETNFNSRDEKIAKQNQDVKVI